MKFFIAFLILQATLPVFAQKQDSTSSMQALLELGVNFRMLDTQNYSSKGPLVLYYNMGLRTSRKQKLDFGFLISATTINGSITPGIISRIYFKNKSKSKRELFVGARLGIGNASRDIERPYGMELGLVFRHNEAIHIGLDAYKRNTTGERRFTIGARATGKRALFTGIFLLGIRLITGLYNIGSG